ncbi:vomeronasal type-1 receptor 4 [Rattus norvegicus]|uniref:Vomeronasal type-1 receptor n=1 Tax=Rattus norvegicus TaxID=10116 RepID=Q5J3F0_RAT|nr:vomeronasal type-1 receptor 4 [Rattus norvegicus]|eukprot:NP_001008969.1 vomeronasal 1 receptor 31 [Rattus norvegicus]
MDFWNLAIRIIFLSQIIIGILGNVSLLFYYLVLYYREFTLKSTELILMHLMVANIIIIFSAGVPQTMTIWGMKQFLNDFGCKLLLYIHAVGRSVSICTTCLLSVFQAMTIRPQKFCGNDHKVTMERYLGCFISFLWVLYFLVNFIFLVYTYIKKNSNNETRKRDFGYCSTVGSDKISDSLYATLVMCPEVFFSVLIAWSSGSMIVILYRHKQKVKYIYSTHVSRRDYPESRATQNILAQMFTFLAFYTLSSTLRGSIALLSNHSWWLMNINHFTSLCFPSFGPFVLMSHYSIVSRFILFWLRKNCSNFLL